MFKIERLWNLWRWCVDGDLCLSDPVTAGYNWLEEEIKGKIKKERKNSELTERRTKIKKG